MFNFRSFEMFLANCKGRYLFDTKKRITRTKLYKWFSLFQETYFNEEEFPRSFTKGTYEGFWWAFVSMTTVG